MTKGFNAGLANRPYLVFDYHICICYPEHHIVCICVKNNKTCLHVQENEKSTPE